jgi:acyl dehydratase
VDVRRRLAALGAALVAAAGLAACTSARNGLGTPVDACYRALPVAAAAVGHQGRFAGVVLAGDRLLHGDTAFAQEVQRRGGPSVHAACVVGFRGHFAVASVHDAVVAGHGPLRWAIAVVSSPGNDLIVTVLTSRPPFDLAELL